jgi:hypothetical protein
MYRIDIKKWKQAVEEAVGQPELLTLLYSIRAQGRGRVHRTWGQPIGYGCKMTLDAFWQKQYVGEAWRQFERVVVEQKAA